MVMMMVMIIIWWWWCCCCWWWSWFYDDNVELMYDYWYIDACLIIINLRFGLSLTPLIPYSTQSIVRYFIFFFFLKVFHLMWCDYIFVSIHPSIHQFINLFKYLFIHIFIFLSSFYLSEVLHSPPRASQELVVSSGAAAQQEERRPGSHQRPSTGEGCGGGGLSCWWMDEWVDGMD